MKYIVKSIFVPKRMALPLLFLLASVAPVMAQNGINSPFSQYGLGYNNMPYNMPAFAANGGVTYTFSANNTINPFNPASYASIGMESFVFDMGLDIQITKLRENNMSQNDADGELGYLAFGFPLLKWWKTALGVMPMSDVNYKSVQTVAGSPWGECKTIYEGFGGVSQFFWGNGFNIINRGEEGKPALRAGFNVNYLYGTLTRGITYDFQGNDTSYFINSRKQKDTYVKNVTFDLGLQYEQPLGENYRLDIGLLVKPHRTMHVTDNALVYTYVVNALSEYMRDTIFPARGDDSRYQSTLEQPFTTGIGIALQRNDRWRVSVDATLAPWSGLKYTENISTNIFGQNTMVYDKSRRIAVGLQLLGDKKSSNYLRRITFSAGGHYESGRLYLHMADNSDYTLNEWGAGIGMSMPMRKGRSVLNIALNYSSFGTIDLLRRDALTIGISVGSCESWFVKRKYN